MSDPITKKNHYTEQDYAQMKRMLDNMVEDAISTVYKWNTRDPELKFALEFLLGQVG